MVDANSVYNSKSDSYGYSLINKGANRAKDAVTTGFNQANAALNQGRDSGLSYLSQLYGQAQQYYQPQMEASYGALDKYMDLLGMPRYSQGSSAMLDASKELQSMKGKLGSFDAEYARTEAEMASALKNFKANVSGSNSQEILQKAAVAKQALADSYTTRLNSIKQQKAQAEAAIGQFESGDSRLQMTDAATQQASVLEALQQTPGFQFNLTQGLNSIQNSAAAKGSLQSGRTMKQIGEYSQGLAENTYQNAVGNAANATNSLGQYTTQAANAATQQGGLGLQAYMQTGQNLAQTATGYGSDIGNIDLSQASALSSIYQAAMQRQAAASASNAQSQAYRSGLTGSGY